MSVPQAKHLTKFINSIMPLSLYLPLTIDNLEQKRMTPAKNYDTNMLEPGLLEMLDGTFVICDETFMKEG